MDKFQSKEVLINLTPGDIYERFRRMDALTPMVGDRVEGWEADEDSCSLRVQGFPIRLRIAERIPGHSITLTSDSGTPFAFTAAVLLADAPEGKTTMNLMLEIELNMVMKMMIGSRLQSGVDSAAELIAAHLNGAV